MGNFIKFHKVKRVENDPNVKLPVRSTSGSAGYDFYFPEPHYIISAGSISKRFMLGIKAEIPDLYFLEILIRSGLGAKGLAICESGIIDSDYFNNPTNEGEIGITFVNHGVDDITIKTGDKICQGIFQRYFIADDDEPIKKERTGGFGSTGK